MTSPSHPAYTPAISTTKGTNTMGMPDIPTRKARLQKILTTIEASSYNFDLANQTQLLTTISRLTVGLCEHNDTLIAN